MGHEVQEGKKIAVGNANGKAMAGMRLRSMNWVLVFLLAVIAAQAQALTEGMGKRWNEYDAFVQREYSGGAKDIGPYLALQALPSFWEQNRHAEVIRAVASPDVAVFPVRVAGPAVAVRRNPAANKVALEGGADSITVIYPEIAEPYRSVFSQIIDGIKDKARGHVSDIALTPGVNVDQLRDSLLSRNTKVVIALGHQGMKLASSLDHGLGVVVGCVLTAPESGTHEVQINSLSPDPALLFARLKNMMPRARRIFAVYNPRHNDWMMRLAKEAARKQGLELVTYEAQDLRSAINAYREIFANTNGDRDALWLPQDSTTVEDGSVLPLVLKESWNHNLAVFSSSFGHVRRGVLFSLYPDNVALGRYLAGSALDILASGTNSGGILPLREVMMAVNLRTARHLDIDVGRQQKFDLAFPER